MNRLPHTLVVPLICQHFAISEGSLLSDSIARECSYPRSLAMYLMHGTGRSLTQVGTRFGRHKSAVSMAVRRVRRREAAGDVRLMDDLALMLRDVRGLA